MIDNFTSNAGYDHTTGKASGPIYIFNKLPDVVFGAPNPETGEPITNIYQITKSIKLLNMSAENGMEERIRISDGEGENYNMLYSIPVERTYKNEE